MKFAVKIVLWVVTLELALFIGVGVIIASNATPGGWQAAMPIFYQAGIAVMIVGGLIAFMIATLTRREISLKTGSMQEGWERTLRILNSVPAGIVIIDPVEHIIVDANKTALEAFKAPKRKVVGASCHKYLCPAEKDYCPVTDLGEESDNSEGLLVTAKGDSVPIFKSAVSIEFRGRPHLVEIFFDLSERKELERCLKEAYNQQKNMANYDLLTNVLNRRAITGHAEAELNRAERGGALSLLMLDLDHFKRINDTQGHLVGDEVLRRTAGVISESIRPYDWVGRWGGEEFLVLLPNTGIEEATLIAERIRVAVGDTSIRLDDGEELRFTVSIGVSSTALSNRTFVGLNTLISQADDALYKAKGEGRNKVCVTSI